MTATGLCRAPRRRQRRSEGRLAPRRVALFLAMAGILTGAASQRSAAQEDPDEAYVGPLINQALESQRTGVEVPWTNPATGSSGTIVVERTFYRDPRTPCRDYRRTVERGGGAPVQIEGTGCRIGSGRWSLDEEDPEPMREASTRGAPREAGTATAPEAEPESTATPPNCPAPSPAPAACDEPAAIVDYTMPTRTEL